MVIHSQAKAAWGPLPTSLKPQFSPFTNAWVHCAIVTDLIKRGEVNISNPKRQEQRYAQLTLSKLGLFDKSWRSVSAEECRWSWLRQFDQRGLWVQQAQSQRTSAQSRHNARERERSPIVYRAFRKHYRRGEGCQQLLRGHCWGKSALNYLNICKM